jgi:hypothetical protein
MLELLPLFPGPAGEAPPAPTVMLIEPDVESSAAMAFNPPPVLSLATELM